MHATCIKKNIIRCHDSQLGVKSEEGVKREVVKVKVWQKACESHLFCGLSANLPCAPLSLAEWRVQSARREKHGELGELGHSSDTRLECKML